MTSTKTNCVTVMTNLCPLSSISFGTAQLRISPRRFRPCHCRFIIWRFVLSVLYDVSLANLATPLAPLWDVICMKHGQLESVSFSHWYHDRPPHCTRASARECLD